MAADSNSMIAWHRAQIRKHREALRHLETAKFTFGEISGAKSAHRDRKTAAELKARIRESEAIVAAHERQTRRPLATDFRTLSSAPWSNWNGQRPAKQG
jgi:diphthamide synthase subunit DPH2